MIQKIKPVVIWLSDSIGYYPGGGLTEAT